MAIAAGDQTVVRFGPFKLAVSERLLTRDGVTVDLGARALDILIALVTSPNEIVRKKDLMAMVWPDAVVEEVSLRFHMAGLRKALGDGLDGARYITTIAGRGYCFVAPTVGMGKAQLRIRFHMPIFPRSSREWSAATSMS